MNVLKRISYIVRGKSDVLFDGTEDPEQQPEVAHPRPPPAAGSPVMVRADVEGLRG